MIKLKEGSTFGKFWGYGGLPPTLWNVNFPEAAQGHQSPIAVEATTAIVDPNARPIALSYKPVDLNPFLLDGHLEIEVSGTGAGGSIQIDANVFTLRQFHIHTPAEHVINGHRHEMEIHFVHDPVNGRQIVVAVLVSDKGTQDFPFLKQLASHAPHMRVKKPAQVDPMKAFSSPQPAYWKYEGSLTTPPCSETIDWYVTQQPHLATTAQIKDFQIYMPAGNARPLQNRNDRPIYRYP